MRIDLGTLAFGYKVRSGGATPNWATALGQNKEYKINDDPMIDDMLKGIIYCSVPLDKVATKIGKGGRLVYGNNSDKRFVLAAVFPYVYVNAILIPNAKFILLITKDDSDSHSGRLRLKYGPSNTCTEDDYTFSNADFYEKVRKQFNLAEDACWFVSSIDVKNQNELHFKAHVVNPDGVQEYETSSDLHAAWKNLIGDAGDNELESTEKGYLSPNWFARIAQQYTSADIEAEQLYKDFVSKYGPEALKAVSGLDLLHKIFINETRDKENLCYVLEFDKQYTQFGGIGGGSAYKYGLYYDVKKQSWMTGAGRSPKFLTEAEAIELGTRIRDEILKGVDVINSISDFSKLSDYVELNSKLYDVMPTIINKKWVMKYFHMLFPQVFPPFYNYDWQTRVLETIDAEPDETALVRMGQIALFVKQCGISPLAFSKVIYNLDSLDFSEEENTSAIIEPYTFDSGIGNGKNVVVYGTPGCGKSYYVQNKLLAQFGIANDEQHRIRTTFYQDYTNTDFVGQIIPKVKADKSVTYEFNPGPFALALKMAIKQPNEAVALIIEELNRGNAASIFGDIFQLLDRNEKGQSQYKITNVNLQDYLNDQFKEQNVCFDYIVIPSNLYIVATMNTSDQNVFTLDTAFKRRWKFEKLPNVFANDHEYAKYFVPGMEKVTWEELVNKINRFIVSRADELSSEDKQLGVYFIGKDSLCENLDEVTNENKKREFAYKLLEYLWDDVAKYSHSDWFDPEIKTLDQLITEYMKNGQKVFVNGIFE